MNSTEIQARILLRNFVDLIHEDIFEKTPRGQVREGESVQMTRCKDLLKLADEVRDFLLLDDT